MEQCFYIESLYFCIFHVCEHSCKPADRDETSKEEDWHMDLLLFSAFWSAYRLKKALQLLRIHPFIFIRCRPSGAVWGSVCCSRALKHQWTTCSTFWATAASILINRWMQTNHVKNIQINLLYKCFRRNCSISNRTLNTEHWVQAGHENSTGHLQAPDICLTGSFLRKPHSARMSQCISELVWSRHVTCIHKVFLFL